MSLTALTNVPAIDARKVGELLFFFFVFIKERFEIPLLPRLTVKTVL